MKNWITSVLVNKILNSRKFVYALTAIVTPWLMTNFGWSPEVAETVWQTFLVLILGQGVADINKK
tara:strand:+ start:1646 stop:1840 length:195 start_codon:yes stop_codon:yes gene_type:complete